MKITLESTVYDEKTKATIEVDYDDIHINDVWEKLIKPVLIAYGFHPDTVNSLVSTED